MLKKILIPEYGDFKRVFLEHDKTRINLLLLEIVRKKVKLVSFLILFLIPNVYFSFHRYL